MMSRALLLVVAAGAGVGLTACAALGQPVESAGGIDSVTVYRGQALVTRVVEVGGAPGLREVVVTGLPQQVIPGSLYAESADGVEVRSVRYRERPVAEDARESVRKLEEQIRAASDALELARIRQKLLEHNALYLDKIEQFLGATGTVEMGKGVLNAETISKLTEFLFTARDKQVETGQKLAAEARGHQEKKELLQRELAVLTAKSSRTVREAVVFVSMARAGGQVRLNYLVNSATWSPSYNFREGTLAAPNQVAVEYQASIQQMSGEDWTDVKMTLSTATPALVAGRPSLEPMTIALAAGPPPQQPAPAGGALAYADAWRQLESRKIQVAQARNASVLLIQGQSGQVAAQMDDGTRGNGGGQAFDRDLNRVANDQQLLDLLTNEKVDKKETKAPVQARTEEDVSVTYKIASRTSLPSRSDQQLIQIVQAPCAADFYRVATPVLTGSIYNEAMATNTSDLVFLSGPVSSYVDGEFVGHGRVPTVAAGQRFTCGLGIDSSLRASRELVERAEKIQGGNRVVEFTYRLVLENFGKEAAVVRVLDRVPQPSGPEITLTMGKSTPELSKDAAYELKEKKAGILRWDVTVPAGASGMSAYVVEYSFTLVYDKQMGIAESAKK